jgi:hypothetical protein
MTVHAETQLIPTTRPPRTFEVVVADQRDTVDVLGIEIPREPTSEQAELTRLISLFSPLESLQFAESIDDTILSLETFKAEYQSNLHNYAIEIKSIRQNYRINQEELLAQQKEYEEADVNHETAHTRYITLKSQMETIESEVRKHFEALKTTDQSGDDYIEAMQVLINDPRFKKLSTDLRLARSDHELKKAILDEETEKLERLWREKEIITKNLKELAEDARQYVSDVTKYRRKMIRGNRLIAGEPFWQRVSGYVRDLGSTAISGGGITTPTLMMRESMMIGITQGPETDA